MKVVLNFIIFMILIICVEKMIEKTNIHVALINKIKKIQALQKNFIYRIDYYWIYDRNGQTIIKCKIR